MGKLDKVKSIVVLMMENRSFDTCSATSISTRETSHQMAIRLTD